VLLCTSILTVLGQGSYELYGPSNSHITGTWTGNGSFEENKNLSLTEGQYEFTFNYSYTGWWAAVGITIDYWTSGQAPDFGNYDSLVLVYKGVNDGNIFVSIEDGGGTNSSSHTLGYEANWTRVAIPISTFTSGSSVNLADITQIRLSGGGQPAATGSIDICSMKLTSTVSGSVPSISITSPSNLASQTTKSHVDVTVNASDADGSVEEVAYYINDQYLYSVHSSPFTLKFFPQFNDTFKITAKAIDNAGNETMSAPINYVVNYTGTFNQISNNRLGSACNGVNYSNWLEAHWDMTTPGFPDETLYPERYLDSLYDLGIDMIRLPVIFERYADATPPYALQEPHEIFDLVDSMIVWTAERNIYLLIDNHHPEDYIFETTWEQRAERSGAIMRQVVERYDYADAYRVQFELRNEPRFMSPLTLKKYHNQVLDSIRAINTTHTLVIGSAHFNDASNLYKFSTYNDTNVVYTFHDYNPQTFTHQGFSWENYPTTGVTFSSVLSEFRAYEDMQQMRTWGDSLNVRVSLGEFGVSTYADPTSRCQYMDTMTKIADQFEIPWIYWGWISADTADESFGWFTGGEVDSDSIIPCMYSALNCVPEFFAYLPVSWIDFNARLADERVHLAWSTASETNNLGFTIEKSSDARNWDPIGFVDGNGTTQSISKYAFMDQNPYPKNYYRIKQMDYDGKVSYSKLQYIELKNTNTTIYPNPSRGTYNISTDDEVLSVSVYSINGTLQKQMEGGTTFTINELQNGTYFLKINTTSGIITKRIIKI